MSERNEHYCPFCGEGWPEEKRAAWEAYDLVRELAEDDGGIVGLRALDVLRRLAERGGA